MRLSDLLKSYLFEYLDWVERGAPQDQPFSRFCGLCYNAYDASLDVIDLQKLHDADGQPSIFKRQPYVDELKRDLHAALRESFGSHSASYPFDEDSYAYTIDDNKHLNQARIAWVRKMLEDNFEASVASYLEP